jgi:DNA polymerase III delta subunit
VASRRFEESDLPAFDSSPSVILVSGQIDFFVEEAAEKVAEAFVAEGAERLRFDDEASPEAVTDALLNRSLFSPRRVVQLDATPILGTEAPGELFDAALESWRDGAPSARRDAFRRARSLLAALRLEGVTDPAATATAVARKLKKSDPDETFAELLRQLPEGKAVTSLIVPALQTILGRGNDGVIALLTAVKPPKGAALLDEFQRKGLVFEFAVDKKEIPAALRRYARARAEEREVAFDADAIESLIKQTGGRSEIFAAELAKLLAWAGKGGRIRAADVPGLIEDVSSENLYTFYDVLARRDAGAALSQLERILSGHPVVMGEKEIDTEEYWPIRFLSLLAGEVRRMLLMRERLDDPAAGYAAGITYEAFKARVLPRLLEMDRAPGRSISAGKPFAVYKLAERAARYRTEELVRALARAADVDVQLKNSIPPLAALSAYVGSVIAGE